MKRLILFVFLSFLALQGFAQLNNFMGIYAGAGLASKYNYDAGISGGFEFLKGLGNRTALGATLFYQGYAFHVDNEAYSAKNGTGNAGFTLLNKSSYIFIAPKLSHGIGRGELVKYYFDAGAGFKMSGTENVRKWDFSHGSAPGNYDSTISTGGNLNSLLFRLGCGLTEYAHLSGKWWFTFNEDAGFLVNTISKTSDFDNPSPSRTPYSPNKLNPAYFSVQIGITRSRY